MYLSYYKKQLDSGFVGIKVCGVDEGKEIEIMQRDQGSSPCSAGLTLVHKSILVT